MEIMKKVLLLAIFFIVCFLNLKSQVDFKFNEKGIVTVKSYKGDTLLSQGIGFFIDSIGTIVTDYNIIKSNFDRVEVFTIDNKKYNLKNVTGIDEQSRLIKFVISNNNKEKFNFLRIDYDYEVEEDNEVKILDFKNNKFKIQSCNVIGVKYFKKYGNVFEVNYSIKEENTGLPVFNLNGKVIGMMVYGVVKNNDGNTFVIDINRIKNMKNVNEMGNKFNKLTFYNYYLQSLIDMKNNRWDDATINITKAIEIDPENSVLYTRLGEIHISKQMYKEAINDFTKVLGYNNNDDNAFYNIGLCYFRMNMFNETFDYCNRAIEYNSKNKEAYCLKGETLFELGTISEAIVAFTKAIEVDSKYGYAYYMRGVSYTFINNKEKACKDFENALKYKINEAKDIYNQICGEKEGLKNE